MTGALAGTTFLALGDTADFGETYLGEMLDDSCIVAKYTYFGDANCDGRVVSHCYEVLTYCLGPTPASWLHGDLDFDDVVTAMTASQSTETGALVWAIRCSIGGNDR